MTMKKKKIPQFLDDHPPVRWTWLVTLLLFPILLWMLPSDFFDNSETILCPSRLLLGIECYGCGITRATMHMHHFELEDALFFNVLSVIVYPGLVAVWGHWVYKNLKALGLIKGFSFGS